MKKVMDMDEMARFCLTVYNPWNSKGNADYTFAQHVMSVKRYVLDSGFRFEYNSQSGMFTYTDEAEPEKYMTPVGKDGKENWAPSREEEAAGELERRLYEDNKPAGEEDYLQNPFSPPPVLGTDSTEEGQWW